MIESNDYVINFTSFEIGEHILDFKIDNSLFQRFENDDLLGLDIDLRVKLIKEERILAFDFCFNGLINVLCDRCLEPLDFGIEGERTLFIKFGDEYLEQESENEDIIVIPNTEYEIDISHYLYELILLQIPIRCAHEEGKCNSDMIERINSSEPAIEQEIDPRWLELKKIKFEE